MVYHVLVTTPPPPPLPSLDVDGFKSLLIITMLLLPDNMAAGCLTKPLELQFLIAPPSTP